MNGRNDDQVRNHRSQPRKDRLLTAGEEGGPASSGSRRGSLGSWSQVAVGCMRDQQVDWVDLGSDVVAQTVCWGEKGAELKFSIHQLINVPSITSGDDLKSHDRKKREYSTRGCNGFALSGGWAQPDRYGEKLEHPGGTQRRAASPPSASPPGCLPGEVLWGRRTRRRPRKSPGLGFPLMNRWR